ncbi:hypothetical protein [Pseudohongiella spirulinae]|uniref:hypothetical protein n=1 Tax=Pseudohongiella spirulinae TaxID=1249552 RepID=UPI0012E37A07|nr:hypothetical protein [Pseudohongiella spirulinae]
MTSPQVKAISLHNYYDYSCIPADVSTAAPTLSLLMVTPTRAIDVAESLCLSDAVSKHYGRVNVSWKPRTQLDASDLINERYDLIWNREHFLRGLQPDFATYYESLLHFDNYRVFWLSLKSAPVMSAEYFQNKRVGLLDDPSSHTHHVLPLTSLRLHQIPESVYSIIYFNDASALYHSFLNGDIDLISGGATMFPAEQIYTAKLTDNATAATFFIRRALQNQSIRCELINALSMLESLWHGIESHPEKTAEC